jgi:hypothetical protein
MKTKSSGFQSNVIKASILSAIVLAVSCGRSETSQSESAAVVSKPVTVTGQQVLRCFQSIPIDSEVGDEKYDAVVKCASLMITFRQESYANFKITTNENSSIAEFTVLLLVAPLSTEKLIKGFRNAKVLTQKDLVKIAREAKE